MAEAIPDVFSRGEKQLLLGQPIFAKQKTKKAERENDRDLIKGTKEVNMQPLILLAVVSAIVFCVLIIVGWLCYVELRGHRMS